jgi:hypothetical protein
MLTKQARIELGDNRLFLYVALDAGTRNYLEAIQKELGREDAQQEIDAYKDKAKKLKVSAEAKEIATTADLVFVPVGADPAGAYKAATAYDPNVIIPYLYDQTSLARFLKEGGQEKTTPEEKATLKRRDLDGKEGHIIVLAPQD